MALLKLVTGFALLASSAKRSAEDEEQAERGMPTCFSDFVHVEITGEHVRCKGVHLFTHSDTQAIEYGSKFLINLNLHVQMCTYIYAFVQWSMVQAFKNLFFHNLKMHKIELAASANF